VNHDKTEVGAQHTNILAQFAKSKGINSTMASQTTMYKILQTDGPTNR